ncbi:hypothetical protein GCM10027265_34660 [Jatrophihabitans fulvus]
MFDDGVWAEAFARRKHPDNVDDDAWPQIAPCPKPRLSIVRSATGRRPSAGVSGLRPGRQTGLSYAESVRRERPMLHGCGGLEHTTPGPVFTAHGTRPRNPLGRV